MTLSKIIGNLFDLFFYLNIFFWLVFYFVLIEFIDANFNRSVLYRIILIIISVAILWQTVKAFFRLTPGLFSLSLLGFYHSDLKLGLCKRLFYIGFICFFLLVFPFLFGFGAIKKTDFYSVATNYMSQNSQELLNCDSIKSYGNFPNVITDFDGSKKQIEVNIVAFPKNVTYPFFRQCGS